ncbi:hypothetical protein PRZ48_000042 [Zasmidium cellare]|uniref:Uncharacterized protein n=1 Tax=Zasmidium cellare TaxID=395010 RepID=A0ABR0EXE5_ZASCE|nr:hypothetical protein PRZ48_000042 [Zasmidium cellare]
MRSRGQTGHIGQGVPYETPESPPATLGEILGHFQAHSSRLRQTMPPSAGSKRTGTRRSPIRSATHHPGSTPGEDKTHAQWRQGPGSAQSPASNETHGQNGSQLGTRRLPRPANTGGFEPFDVFPVQIDDGFMALFERYYRGYRWEQSKQKLLAQTAGDALLCHSFLAIAHNVYYPNEVEALKHETQTIQVISKALKSSAAETSPKAADANVSLTWAISRLAMIRAQQGDWETALRHMNACVMTSGPIPSVVNHKFGSHLLCTFMIVLLSNFIVTRAVVPNLWQPYGESSRSILAEVEALGFKLPLASLMSLRGQDIDSELRDILCALSALCFPVPCAQESHATHLVRQGIEMLKIGLWLAELSPLNHDALGDAPAPEWHEELQDCLRLAASLFVLSPSPMSRDATRNLRRKLTPALLLSAIGAQEQAKTVRAALPFWILLVAGATAHDTADQMHFAKLITRFYPGFFDHAISGPEVPFSRLSGKFLPPTLDCLIAGIPYLTSANGWTFGPEESKQWRQPVERAPSTHLESGHTGSSRTDVQKWRKSSFGAATETSAKYFLDLYIKITQCKPDKHTVDPSSPEEPSQRPVQDQELVDVHCQVEFETFSIDDEFLSF